MSIKNKKQNKTKTLPLQYPAGRVQRDPGRVHLRLLVLQTGRPEVPLELRAASPALLIQGQLGRWACYFKTA